MPRPSDQEPVASPVNDGSGDRGTHYEHPAFGQIRASRVSGDTTLYGSDFVHHNFVSISISRSNLERRLSHDWHFAKNEMIEVNLSEAQWATFVSSMNVGSGVPCTINHLDGKGVPGISLPPRPTTQFKDEIHEAVSRGLREIDSVIAEIGGITMPKGRRDGIVNKLRMAAQHLRSNLPFVAKSFDEHMERIVEKAKIEVNAYLTHAVHDAGLTALSNGKNNAKLITFGEGGKEV